MNYGVTITKGAAPYQIFQQRADGTAEIHLFGQCRRIHQSFELPLQFEEINTGDVTVKARIAREDSGENIVPWTKCNVTDNACWDIVFDAVPYGGLYRIETYMEYAGWDGLSTTRGDIVHNIGVGDVFVIAGQSNAAGRAKTPVTDTPELGVHVFRPSEKWDIATHPLADTTDGIHIGNFENHNPGHTPWLAFAKRIKAEMGYPIGLVPCAYGGSPLRWWNPDENGALLKNMLEHLGGIKPKAVLWYQGEAEGYEKAAQTYLQRFEAFVGHVRKALNLPDLYFFTVQLNRCVNESTEELDRQWGIAREAQRMASATINNLAIVPSNDLSLYDFIHNSTEANLVVAQRVASAALALLYNKRIIWKAPQADSAVKISSDTIKLTFNNIYNWLNPYDVPAAILPFNAEDSDGLLNVKSYVTGQNDLTITFDRDFNGKAVLHGAWRMNHGGLIPCDCMRLPMLSFYNFDIE